MLSPLSSELISNKAWMARLAAERYDILLASPYNGCPMGLHHVLQIPAMIFFVATPSTDLIPEFMGVVMPPSFVSSNRLFFGFNFTS